MLGVSIGFSIDYSDSAEDWRGLNMSIIYSDTIDVVGLQQSDLVNFSDTVTSL